MTRSPDQKLQASPPTSPEQPCHICGSVPHARFKLRALKRRLAADTEFRVDWCHECDAGFLCPRPTAAMMEKLYPDEYFSLYGQPVEFDQSWLDRIMQNLAWRLDRGAVSNASFFKELLGIRSAKVCDLGCGNGAMLEGFRDLGFDVVGIEPSSFARSRMEAKAIRVYGGTAEDLPSPVEEVPFDLLTMMHVLEDCVEPRDAVRNALGLVRPGGYLAIEVPNCGSFQFQQRGPVWFHFDAGRHLNYFTKRSLERVFEHFPVEVTRFWYCQYQNHFHPARLAAELASWNALHAEQHEIDVSGIRKPSRMNNWLSLARTWALEPQRKYGCIGILVRKH